ncbi:MAG: eukaryotic-like serine/threonine-protein kinase [Solirubrobacteraceae bacterium]|jgi:serine/threonine-protein kinase|nr:eukaryotic-like serine/threonine-protein kinase [Solirubrobacteraceae bacterium]
MPLASKIELPERYRVERHIANGGMASVWEVEDLLLGRIVAVKVLGAQFASDPGARARFQREARTAAQVSVHPHVVTIYDIGEHGDDTFIVMEHFSGGTVADRIKAAGRNGGPPVDRDTTLRWLREAAAGLDVAHEAGIVHRDVKPANLLLDAQGRLAVADFGIARLADDTHMTQAGQVLGTAAYLSPEQATGLPATQASDRYALAVVAYELLSGRRPFEAEMPAAQMLQHAEEPPPAASDARPQLPAAVDAVLKRGLAKDPAQRPATATQLVDELEQALAGTPAAVTDTTRPMAPVAAAIPVAEPEPEPEPVPAPPPPVRRQIPTPAPAAAAPPWPSSPAASPRREPPAPVSRSQPSRSHSRLPLIGVLAVVAILVGGVVGLAARKDSKRSGRASASRTSTQHASSGTASKASQTTPSAATPAATTPAPSTQKPASASSSNPVALNDQGFQHIKSGDYAGAVPPLRQAVQAFRDADRTSELAYYFALFNLGQALNRSGNPAEAIPYLQERLRNPNQRGTVQRELSSAQAKLAGGTGKKVKPGKAGKGQGD